MKRLFELVIVLCVGTTLFLNATGCKTDKDNRGKIPSREVVVAAEPVKISTEEGVAKSKTVGLYLERGADANKEVTLSVAGATDTVKATLESDTVAGDRNKAVLKVEVTKDAKPGEIKITVAAKSEDSKDSKVEITVIVARKATLDFAAIDKNVTIKQGGEGIAKVKITLGMDVKQATIGGFLVRDKDNKDAKDVTVQADPAKLDVSGEATVTITVGEGVPVGDYTLFVSAAGLNSHPDAGVIRISLTVDKK